MAITVTEKIATIFRLMKDTKALQALFTQYHSGFLMETGWLESFRTKSACDKNGSPLPWVTLPFVSFVEARLTKSMRIFEFGSGNSTLFFAPRVASVSSAEHNAEWFSAITSKAPRNVTLLKVAQENPELYAAAYEPGVLYDLILIDAQHRNECCLSAPDHLSINGVIVLDDSERVEYEKGISHLANIGFKRLDFFGIAPGVLFTKCTTVFYRTNNCLGI